jgi:hypothetical protein
MINSDGKSVPATNALIYYFNRIIIIAATQLEIYWLKYGAAKIVLTRVVSAVPQKLSHSLSAVIGGFAKDFADFRVA